MLYLAENIDTLLLDMWNKVKLSPFIERMYTAPYPVNDQHSYEIRQTLVYFEFEFSLVSFYFKTLTFSNKFSRTAITLVNYLIFYS